MNRSLPFLVATVLVAFPAIAQAKIDVQFSPGVTAASGATAPRLEQELEGATNASLTRIAQDPTASEARDAARRLTAVNQTLRILCREEAASDPALADLVAQSEASAQAGGAATRGAFDDAGNPIEGGTIIMVIECARLPTSGWYGGFGVGNSESMTRVLGHELLHASGRRFRHGDENDADEALYDPFADRFRSTYASLLEDVQREMRAAERRLRRAQRKNKRAGKPNKAKPDPSPPPECPDAHQ